MGRRKLNPKKRNSLKLLLLVPLFGVWILIKFGQLGQFILKFPLNFFSLINFKLFFLFFFGKTFKWEISKSKIFLILVTILLSAIVVIASTNLKGLPSPYKLKQSQSPITTEFYASDGTLLYRLYQDKNRTPVKLSELPPYLVQATISMEDKNFYGHFGIDLFGILRASISMIKDGYVQGGSTITQQLVKNTLLTPERTWQRKLKEVVLSLWVERIYSKYDILEMYFNEVPYGGPAWGIAAAAQTYFNKNVKDLDLAEAAFLAGLPASPTTYSPYGTNPESGRLRQRAVLRRMTEEGFITSEQANKAYSENLNIKARLDEIKAPHFVFHVKNLLSQKYGEKVVLEGGLRVYTSIDLNIQKQTEEIVSKEIENLASLNVNNGAAMVTDAKTGHILAMVGSKNYWDPKFGNFNVATSLRQPGSSIKPITYATAFKKGYSPGTVLLDMPVSFSNAWEVYSPINYDGRFHGPVSIRTALGSSYNVPAVKMLAIVGIPEMVKTAKDMGITTFDDSSKFGLSLTLGGGDVKLIDMMTVYGTLSQLGIKRETSPIIKVTNHAGKVLEDNSAVEGKRVLPVGVAYLITDILTDNKARTPAFGPNSLLQIPGHIVAVKTGTTDSKRDNWTFGYTPEVVIGVWVGNNDNSPMNQALTSGVTGAAPIWNKIITQMLKDKPNLAFAKPSEVKEGTVDNNKDLVLFDKSAKSIIGFGKKKVKDVNDGNKEKDVITFTDPFSTFQSDQTGQIFLQPPNP